jgi:hypothetical protein
MSRDLSHAIHDKHDVFTECITANALLEISDELGTLDVSRAIRT